MQQQRQRQKQQKGKPPSEESGSLQVADVVVSVVTASGGDTLTAIPLEEPR